MSTRPGHIPIDGPFATRDEADPNGIFDDLYFIGGFRGVGSIAIRNAIPTERRKWTMLVTVGTVGAYVTYQLQEGHVDTDLSNNANWVVFATGGTTVIGSDALSPAFVNKTTDTAIADPDAGTYQVITYNITAATAPVVLANFPAATGSTRKVKVKNKNRDFSNTIPHVDGGSFEQGFDPLGITLYDNGANDWQII
jgi:hypothetical protein